MKIIQIFIVIIFISINCLSYDIESDFLYILKSNAICKYDNKESSENCFYEFKRFDVHDFDVLCEKKLIVVGEGNSMDGLYTLREDGIVEKLASVKSIRSVSISPSKKYLAYLFNSGEKGYSLGIYNLEKQKNESIFDINSIYGKPIWFKNNKDIIFSCFDGYIYKINIYTGVRKKIVAGERAAIDKENKKMVFFKHEDDINIEMSMWCFDFEKKIEKKIYKKNFWAPQNITFSPRSEHVFAFNIRQELIYNINFFDLKTNKLQESKITGKISAWQ